MADIITLPDGRRLIRSNGTRTRPRNPGAPPATSNNRAARRNTMTDTPATPKIGPNNQRTLNRANYLRRRFT